MLTTTIVVVRRQRVKNEWTNALILLYAVMLRKGNTLTLLLLLYTALIYNALRASGRCLRLEPLDDELNRCRSAVMCERLGL